MPNYWRYFDLDQSLFLAFVLIQLIFLTRLAYLQRKYSIPWPPPRPWPTPLPAGWRSYFTTIAIGSIPWGAGVMIAGYRYYLHLADLESRGGTIILWVGFEMVYRLAGKIGVFCLASIIGLFFWFMAASMLYKLRSAK